MFDLTLNAVTIAMIVGGWMLLTRSRLLRNKIARTPLDPSAPVDGLTGLIRFVGLFAMIFGVAIFGAYWLGMAHRT